MTAWLLQAADTLVRATQAPALPKAVHLWDILRSGGPIMVPLALLFATALFFFFERNIAIRRAARID